MRPLNDVTVADNLLGGRETATHALLSHRVVHRCQESFFGLARKLASVRVNPRATASDKCSVVSHVTSRIWSGGHNSSSEPSRTDIVEREWRILCQLGRNLRVYELHEEVTMPILCIVRWSHDIGGQFDGFFSVADVGPLSRKECAVGRDGLPHSLFKVALPWWQSTLLNLSTLCLSGNDVPTM